MTESELIERVGSLEKQSRRFRQGATLGLLLVAVLVFMGQSGCQSQQAKQAAAGVPAPFIVRPYQRFLMVPHSMDWAFDTRTGQICKTWGWEDRSGAAQQAMKSGNFSNLTGLVAAAAATQTCEQLWTQYPDEGSLASKRDPLGLFSPAEPVKSK